ncbi:MAG: hypothetical protein RLZZ316_2824 [Bacteroidota bacterium]
MKPATEVTYQKPLITQGWLRALLFQIFYLVFFLGVSMFIVLFTPASKKNSQIESVSIASSFMLFSVSLLAIVSIALVAAFRKIIDRQSFFSLGFKFFSNIKDAFAGLFTGVFLLLVAAILMVLNKNLSWTFSEINSTELFLSFVLMLLVAFYEELVFRGYLLNNLLQSLNQRNALCINALLFALAHLGNPDIGFIGAINIFLAGLLLGINYIFKKNLWFGIFLHFSWNFFQGPVLGFKVSGIAVKSVLSQQTSGSVLITGGSFGLEASLLTSVLFLLAIGFFYVAYKKKFTPDTLK